MTSTKSFDPYIPLEALMRCPSPLLTSAGLQPLGVMHNAPYPAGAVEPRTELVTWDAHIAFLFFCFLRPGMHFSLPRAWKTSLSLIAVCLDKSRTLQRTGCVGSVHANISKIAASPASLGLAGKCSGNGATATSRCCLHLAHSAKRHNLVIFKSSA